MIRIFLLACTVTLIGCATANNTYTPIFSASLAGAQGVVGAFKEKQMQEKNLIGCYTTSALYSALGAAKDALADWSQGKQTYFPSLDVDVSACMKLSPVEGLPLSEQAQNNIRLLAGPVIEMANAALANTNATCKEKLIVSAISRYLGSIADIIMKEVVIPKGKITLPSLSINFTSCNS